MRDLWHEDIGHIDPPRAPVIVLKEQASLLAEKTKGLVEAQVVRDTGDDEFAYSFDMVAPALGNYRFRVFSIEHDVTLYPVYVGFDSDIEDELTVGDGVPKSLAIAEDEEGLMAVVAQVLKSKKVRQVILGIMAQAPAAEAF